MKIEIKILLTSLYDGCTYKDLFICMLHNIEHIIYHSFSIVKQIEYRFDITFVKYNYI